MRALLYMMLIAFLISVNSTLAESPSPELHPIIPFTSKSDMVMCSEIMDIEKIFSRTLSCTLTATHPNSSAFITEEKMSEIKEITNRCFVITPKSADVYSTDEYNYIREFHFFGPITLGFYDIKLRRIYVTQNVDLIQITEHEFQHHILNVLGIRDGDHTHSVWSKCRPPRYSPSDEAKMGNPYKKNDRFYLPKIEGAIKL